MKSWQRVLTAIATPFLLTTACASDPEADLGGSTDDELNYRSTAGQEYSLGTEVAFTLPDSIAALAEGADKEAAITRHAEQLRSDVATAMSTELDRIWPEEERISSAGVAVQLRQASATFADLKATTDGFTMTVRAEFAGIKDLESRLPLVGEGASRYLPIPADLGHGTETLHVSIGRMTRSLNAYPKYLEMFEDGLDISVHVGGDHNDPPMDIQHAQSIYDDLVRAGFHSPVATFADLKIDSGPLDSTIDVQGKSVAVRVRIVHVDMSTPSTRDTLKDAYESAMKNADVVIYDGHAGRQLDYSGVVFAYKPARASLPADQFKDVESTAKQQVYLFNGCETYTGYADKLYENPLKNPENADVITTGNYSAIQRGANQVISFIHSFIDQKNGTWQPRSWDSVLTKMNSVGERSWVHVYGVHGIDDDPKLSPLAEASKVGAECSKDADCGAADSRCLRVSSQKRVCGAACADDAGCPSGTKCILPTGRTSADDQQCAPQ